MMAKEPGLKVERSVAINSLNARYAAIQCSCDFCLESQPHLFTLDQNLTIIPLDKFLSFSVHVFEASPLLLSSMPLFFPLQSHPAIPPATTDLSCGRFVKDLTCRRYAEIS